MNTFLFIYSYLVISYECIKKSTNNKKLIIRYLEEIFVLQHTIWMCTGWEISIKTALGMRVQEIIITWLFKICRMSNYNRD